MNITDYSEAYHTYKAISNGSVKEDDMGIIFEMVEMPDPIYPFNCLNSDAHDGIKDVELCLNVDNDEFLTSLTMKLDGKDIQFDFDGLERDKLDKIIKAMGYIDGRNNEK